MPGYITGIGTSPGYVSRHHKIVNPSCSPKDALDELTFG
jgi:hypothetical protein